MPSTSTVPRLRYTATKVDHWYGECLAILTRHLRRPPSVREMAIYTSRDVSTVFRALSRLVAAGLLAKDPKSRKFKPVK